MLIYTKILYTCYLNIIIFIVKILQKILSNN